MEAAPQPPERPPAVPDAVGPGAYRVADAADPDRHNPAHHAGPGRPVVRQQLRPRRLGLLREVDLPAHRAGPGALLRADRRALLVAGPGHRGRDPRDRRRAPPRADRGLTTGNVSVGPPRIRGGPTALP